MDDLKEDAPILNEAHESLEKVGSSNEDWKVLYEKVQPLLAIVPNLRDKFNQDSIVEALKAKDPQRGQASPNEEAAIARAFLERLEDQEFFTRLHNMILELLLQIEGISGQSKCSITSLSDRVKKKTATLILGLQNAISYILDLSSASDLDSLKRLYLNPPDLRVIDEEDMLPDSSLISSDEQISDLMAKSSLQKSTHQAKSPSSEAISQSSEALVEFVGGAVQLEGTEHGELEGKPKMPISAMGSSVSLDSGVGVSESNSSANIAPCPRRR